MRGNRDSANAEYFGLGMDLLGTAIRGLVLYCVLITTSFWGYQEDRGSFQPVESILILPFLLCNTWIANRFHAKKCFILRVILWTFWYGCSFFFVGNQGAFRLIGFLGFLQSFFHLFLQKTSAHPKTSVLPIWVCRLVGKDTQEEKQLRRFRIKKNNKWCGVLIWICSLVVIIDSKVPSKSHPISASTCVRYMMLVFVIWLILSIILNYIDQEYQHFRQKTQVTPNTFLKIKRMNAIVVVVVVILFALSMFLATETLIRIFSFVLSHVVAFCLNIGLFAISQLSITKLAELLGITMHRADMVVQEGGKVVVEVKDSPGIGSYLLWLCVIGVIVSLVCVLFQIYKGSGANYTIGEDIAKFISKEEGTSRIAGKAAVEKVHFDNSPAGRIRKYYYKKMNRRISKRKAIDARRMTPAELGKNYCTKEEQENIRVITEYYKKARYSDENCKEEEVAAVRKLL